MTVTVRVTVAYAPAPREVFEQTLDVPAGATAADAVLASRLLQEHPMLDWRSLPAGVRGRMIPWERNLLDGDRVELCRPLMVDPKIARRERFVRQGRRGAGLFSTRRPGGKAGY